MNTMSKWRHVCRNQRQKGSPRQKYGCKPGLILDVLYKLTQM